MAESACARGQHEFTRRPRGHSQQIADPGHQNLLEVGARQNLLQHVRKVLYDDDAFRAGVLELMFQFACRIQRVRVDHRHAGAQHAEQSDRILQMFGIIKATRSPGCRPDFFCSQAANAALSASS